MKVSIDDAHARLAELVRRAEDENEVILTRNGIPVVRLVPLNPVRQSRRTLLDQVRTASNTRATPGPSAAQSQDFLYGATGLPE